MDSLGKILENFNFKEPEEVRLIKKYVKDNFDEDAQVLVRERDIAVSVPSAALAGALRMRIPELEKLCKTDKRISLHIGR